MKKKLFVAAFIFVFIGSKAQIAPIEFPTGTLTEESIAKMLDNARKRGTKEIQIQIQSNLLHETMHKQQLGLYSTDYQRGSVPPHINSTGCTNPGFEDGTTNGWTFEGGNASGSNLPCPSCFNTSITPIYQIVNATSSATINNPAASCYTGYTPPCTNGLDNYGGFSVIPPGGGTYALLLNNTCANHKMQQAQYTFVVDPSSNVFIFNYAAVLQDGGHALTASPYFDVTTEDLTTGALPTCAQYSASATSGNLTGWTQSTNSNASSAGGGVYYKPWTTVTLDLQSAVGHTVTVKFSVSDCNQTVHFGYCYIDAQCSSPTTASGVVGICGSTNSNVTLTGPPGFNTYQWYGPSPNLGTAISGATSQTLTTAAAIGDTFLVKTTTSSGCLSSFKIVVQGSVINAVTTSTATCKGGSNGAVAISTGTGTYQYAWTAPGGASMGTNTSTSFNNLQPGTYSVSIIDNVAHCPTKDTTITVVGINPTLQTDSQSVCGSSVVLTAPTSYTNTGYVWYDQSNVLTSTTTRTYTANGAANGQHYTVTYLDSVSHCEDSLRISLAVTNITFNPSPLPSCPAGSTGSITYYPSSGNTYPTFNWVCSSGASGSNAAPPIQVVNLPAGVYTTTLSVPGNTSCQEILTSTVAATSPGVIPVTTNTATLCNLDNLVINPGTFANSTHSWSGPAITYPTNTSTLVITTPFTNTVAAHYTYVDTITTTIVGGCVSQSIYKEVVALKSFKAITTIAERIPCYHDSIGELKTTVSQEINAPISNPDTYTFSWQPIAHTSTATGVGSSSIVSNLKAGTYYCIVQNGNCVDTAKAVTLLDGPQLTGDSIYAYFCPKDSLVLMIADTNNNTNIKWHPDRFVLHDTIRVFVTGDSATVITAYLQNCYVTYKHNGCADTSKAIISVNTYDAFRPNELVNVFSPNGDKSNDFFYPFYQANMNQYQIWKQSDTYELHVYDRWGKSVYDATDYSKPWDGKTKSGHDADNGTYFFIVKYKSNCGSNADVVEKKGFVELVR